MSEHTKKCTLLNDQRFSQFIHDSGLEVIHRQWSRSPLQSDYSPTIAEIELPLASVACSPIRPRHGLIMVAMFRSEGVRLLAAAAPSTFDSNLIDDDHLSDSDRQSSELPNSSRHLEAQSIAIQGNLHVSPAPCRPSTSTSSKAVTSMTAMVINPAYATSLVKPTREPRPSRSYCPSPSASAHSSLSAYSDHDGPAYTQRERSRNMKRQCCQSYRTRSLVG